MNLNEHLNLQIQHFELNPRKQLRILANIDNERLSAYIYGYE
jgi:hypothetical protein